MINNARRLIARKKKKEKHFKIKHDLQPFFWLMTPLFQKLEHGLSAGK